MFGPEYFRTHFHQQRRSVGGTPSVKVQLHDGKGYIVHSIVGIEDGYILLDVYPAEKLDDSYEKRDQVAIAYESISHILITLAKQKEVGKIGFHAEED